MKLKRKEKKILEYCIVSIILAICIFIFGVFDRTDNFQDSTIANFATVQTDEKNKNSIIDLSSIPEYSGEAYVEINGNVPTFTADQLEEAKNSYEYYGNLDELGRCTYAVASVGQDLMPTEKRSSIGSIKPTGWHTVRYDDLISDKYLYNRCHLIGYQLTGENANKLNLITGTRYLNITGMLPFENRVTDYVKETGNHVLYEVTPIFIDDELVARGVHMMAQSIENDSISFNIYAYNVQPGITIDYATGDSWVTK